MLTARQREVVLLLADGLARKEAASMLNLSIKTVDYHLKGIRKRLGFDQVALLTRWAIRNGLIMPLLLAACTGFAADVQLRWHPSPESIAVGYVVYYGPVGTNLLLRRDVGNVTNALVDSLQPCHTSALFYTNGVLAVTATTNVAFASSAYVGVFSLYTTNQNNANRTVCMNVPMHIHIRSATPRVLP